MQWSSQHTVTIVDADANLTPEEILERLNSSFVQGNVILNGSGSIIAYKGASSIPNRDFVLMDAGRLTYQRYRDGQYVEYMGLKRSIGGVAASGATVVIPGYEPDPSIRAEPIPNGRNTPRPQHQKFGNKDHSRGKKSFSQGRPGGNKPVTRHTGHK